jgi:hypothetical protein
MLSHDWGENVRVPYDIGSGVERRLGIKELLSR